MAEKLSYEELERRVQMLQAQNESLEGAIEELRESEEKFKTIFENANDHIAYIALDDRIIDVNHKFENVFGHKRKDVIGRKFYDIG
ncbi:MAG: PAS domain S-box protein, partial [Planctomycetes bacterium]|nr:PAS domain S-box protein [Planctomycetota bacterium]